MSFIIILGLVLASAFCLWLGYLYMVDIFQGHGKLHSYVFGAGLGVAGGCMLNGVYMIVSAW